MLKNGSALLTVYQSAVADADANPDQASVMEESILVSNSPPSAGQDAQPLLLYAPAGIFVVLSLIVSGVWQWLSPLVIEKLRSGRWERRTIHFAAAAILPLALGWFFDILDFSEVIESRKATLAQSVQLTFLAILIVIYVWGHWVLGEIDSASEENEKQLNQKIEELKAKSSVAQSAYHHFANLLNQLQAYLDANGDQLDRHAMEMACSGEPMRMVSVLPQSLFEKNLGNLCRAIQSAISTSVGLQADNLTAVVVGITLFRRKGNLLDYVYSHSTELHYAKDIWEQHKQYFDFGTNLQSAAKEVVGTSRIRVTEDCDVSHSNGDDPFFYFGTTPDLSVKSLLTIPVKVDDEMYCVCLSANIPKAFLDDESHRLMYGSLQQEIRARIRLLHRQRHFLSEFYTCVGKLPHHGTAAAPRPQAANDMQQAGDSGRGQLPDSGERTHIL